MSDKTTDNPQADTAPSEDSSSRTDTPAAAEIPAETEAKPESGSNPAPDAKPAQRATSWTGLIGLCIALLTAAGVGYLWKAQQQQQSLNEQFTNTQRKLETRSTELGHVSDDIETLIAADQKLDNNLAALTKRIERQLEELPSRMTRIEGTLDKIPGVAEQARSAWLLAEAEYFLRIANAQLILAGNVDVSLRALELADTKIKDLNDPGLTRVRAKISAERTALKAVPQPHTESIMLELGSLAQSLHTLPLARTAPGDFSAQTNKGTETGWQRAWRVIVDALSSIISVRRSDEAVTPLMDASEEALLIRSLDIELQIARLALIRNEGMLYRKSLQSVAQRLEQYFAADSQQVKTTLETVSRLAAISLPETLPDISGSLNLLLNLGDEAATP
jgi:uroporphyrin-3 C-methyltransferase